MRAKGIVVLGAERSGTSVVTEMVHRWGAYAGEADELTGPSESSPRGQWEYEPLWDLLAEIGDFADGSTWWDPAFEKRVEVKLNVPDLREKAMALLKRMRSQGVPWVWKDPALCHFLPFWQPLCGDIAYVVTVRHPLDVASSWARMAVPERLQGEVDLTVCNLLRWQHMMLMVLRAIDRVESKLFVEFERLMADPRGEALRLAAFLDKEFELAPDASRIARMAQVVDPSVWRCRVDRPLEEIAESTVAQQRLYGLLRAKVLRAEAEFIDDFPMPEGWWRFVHESEAVVRGAR